MARIYNDGAGTTYDAANAKNNDNAFTTFTPFDFGTNFTKKADNSVAAEMRDCGECHVGGGFMQYYTASADAGKPFQYNPNNRIDYRDAADPAKNPNAAAFNTVNNFNTYIDIFGLDGLGFEPTDHDGVARGPEKLPTYAAKFNDYSSTGVLEMDCLMCHFDGYSWEARRNEVRKGNFDSSRAAGAGLGSSVDARNVVYNSNVATLADGTLALTATAGAKIAGTPKSANCASCHQEMHQVDWKKRGELWTAANDVHYSFGCMACHERKPNAAVGTSGLQSELALGQCDPAKGGTSPFDALWNKVDNTGFKSCSDCHLPSPTVTQAMVDANPSLKLNLNDWNTYGAPNADAAHQSAGLNAILLQAPGVRNGVPSKSHIDLMDCTACHTRNKAGITGGAFVDGTGTDLEGRVAMHDTQSVSKDMANGLALHWLGGKLYSANLLTSFFWRDMNDLNYDANQDGRAGGMDALLQTHVAKINLDAGVKALAEDGVITSEEIAARQALITAGLPALNGVSGTIVPRISMLTVPFKATHNVSPADVAWGKPARDANGNVTAYGCAECHSATGTFYQGAYPVLTGNLSWTFKDGQLARFTKVNGKADESEGHPNIRDKHNQRTVAFTLFNAAPGAAENSGTLINIDRSQVIYESTFKAPTALLTGFTEAAFTATGAPTGCTNSGGNVSTKGHILKIDVERYDAANSKWVTDASRTWSTNTEIAAGATAVDSLVTSMGGFATNFGFTVTNDAGKLKFTPAAGYRIRLNAEATDFAPFGLSANAYASAPQTGVIDATVASGAAQWVSYLNGITPAKAGLLEKPVAVIGAIADLDPAAPGLQVAINTDVTLTAANGQASGFVTYTWSASDATAIAGTQSTKVNFATEGAKTVTLKVTDEDGNNAFATVDLVVVTPPVEMISWADAAGALSGTLTVTGMPAHDKLKFVWGDGRYEYVTSSTANVSRAHLYATAGVKGVQVYFYQGSLLVGSTKKSIEVLGSN